MSKKKIHSGQYVDDDGEVHGLQLCYVVPYSHFPSGTFVTVSKELYRKLAEDKGMTGVTRRVLDELLARVVANNRIPWFRQKDLGEMIGLKRQAVGRAIAELVGNDIVRLNKQNRSYYFNPEYVYTGGMLEPQVKSKRPKE